MIASVSPQPLFIVAVDFEEVAAAFAATIGGGGGDAHEASESEEVRIEIAGVFERRKEPRALSPHVEMMLLLRVEDPPPPVSGESTPPLPPVASASTPTPPPLVEHEERSEEVAFRGGNFPDERGVRLADTAVLMLRLECERSMRNAEAMTPVRLLSRLMLAELFPLPVGVCCCVEVKEALPPTTLSSE